MQTITSPSTRTFYSYLKQKSEKIGPFTGLVINTAELKLSAYTLRHQVYCEELGWQPTHISGLEIDQFDHHATLLGVINATGDVIATIRLLDGHNDWLVDGCFANTLTEPTSVLKNTGCIEASRLAIAEPWRNVSIDEHGSTVLDLLLITLINYAWEREHKQSVLITTTPVMGVTLKRRGIAIEQQGSIITMADNCKIATFICDLEVTRDQYRNYIHYTNQQNWILSKPQSVA